MGADRRAGAWHTYHHLQRTAAAHAAISPEDGLHGLLHLSILHTLGVDEADTSVAGAPAEPHLQRHAPNRSTSREKPRERGRSRRHPLLSKRRHDARGQAPLPEIMTDPTTRAPGPRLQDLHIKTPPPPSPAWIDDRPHSPRTRAGVTRNDDGITPCPRILPGLGARAPLPPSETRGKDKAPSARGLDGRTWYESGPSPTNAISDM